MKLTRSIRRDLAIYMIGFGILIGIVFPFFMLAFGVDKSVALSPFFIITCIMAGAFVGAANILLSQLVVITRLKAMTEKMVLIKDNVTRVAQGNDHEKCDLSVCQVRIDSDDEIGENAHAYNQLVETLALTMSGEELISQLDQKIIVEKSLPQMMNVTSSSAGAIFVEKEGELVVAEAIGIKNVETLIKNDIIIKVASELKGTSLYLPDDIVIDGILVEMKPSEVVIKPIQFNGVRIGVVLMASTQQYSIEQHNKMGIIIKNLALALHNAIIHEQIQQLAAIDPLTGIYNRRFGMSRLKEEFARSVRNQTPLGIVMLDLDYFKRINDSFGHLAGDKVIVSIAKIIKSSLRDGDVLLRYGGEEFLLVLPGVSQGNALNITEKIRRIIEEAIIQYNDVEIRMTCSMGVGSIPENTVSNETEFVSKVDEALYLSKRKGRNKITLVK